MRRTTLLVLFLLLAATTRATGPVTGSARLDPLGFTQVRFTSGFWATKAEINRAATMSAVVDKNDETGRIDNVAIAARLKAGKYGGGTRTAGVLRRRRGQ